MFNLSGRTILVTGGGSGIGAATARSLAEAGGHVLITDVNPTSCAEATSNITARGGSASWCLMDVTKEGSVKEAVALAIERYGSIDGGCIVAGIGPAKKRIHELTLAEWNRVLEVNLTGAFLSLKHLLIPMIQQKRGSIVVVASTAAWLGAVGGGEYCSSKAGLLGLVRTASAENAKQGVRINAVLPGATHTPLFGEGLPENVRAAVAAEHPMGRFAQPVEIAQAIRWLLSDEASFVTGTALAVDGGRTAV